MDTTTRPLTAAELVATAASSAGPLVLQPSDLPIPPLQLPCAVCSRHLHDHGGNPPDCTGFTRPRLPAGYAYVDELSAGSRFRFLSRGSDSCGREALHRPFPLDEANGLLQLQTTSDACADTAHLVQATTIVRIEASAA
ncbi:hypothetical protein [Nocardioides bigeumensis]|jgi:hypothetical protein|uniref:Uncharacterized protein n=1 Tax=Nocardioides bigeumensis TaxID=433657 RepID=A0ABP5JBS2_9ACTN